MEQGSFNEVAKRALEFRQQYYKLLDDPMQRGKIAELYAPDVPDLCEWNGHALSTRDAIQSYLMELPPTSHAIDSLDAQPLPGNENGDSFLITVHGIVTYDDEHKREFYQRFVIRRINNQFFIYNDYYRWLAEKV